MSKQMRSQGLKNNVVVTAWDPRDCHDNIRCLFHTVNVKGAKEVL